jgi:hypothetical protein
VDETYGSVKESEADQILRNKALIIDEIESTVRHKAAMPQQVLQADMWCCTQHPAQVFISGCSALMTTHATTSADSWRHCGNCHRLL